MIRKFCGWLFGFVSVVCVCLLFWFSRSTLVRHRGIPTLSLLVPGAVLLLFAIVFGMTWWKTWKEEPSARACGITASLMNMSVPLSSMYFFHSSVWQFRFNVIVFSSLALVAYF